MKIQSEEFQQPDLLPSQKKRLKKWWILLFNLLNSGTAIFIIILVNSFTTKKYINRATRYQVSADLLYLNITLGLMYSTVFSGKLNLIKNISLSQLFMLSFLIQTYKLENVGMICFTLALLLGIFMGLKLQNAYKFIPRCVLVGAKITMNFLLVFQMLFNLTLDSKPPFVLTIQSYLKYFINNFQQFPYSLMVIFSSFLIWIYLVQQRHRKFPFVFVIFVLGILGGFIFSTYTEVENIATYKLNSVYETLFEHLFRKTEVPRVLDFSLLSNSNFILHCTLYGGLVFIEFIISISLLKHNSQKESDCEREIYCMIVANLVHAVLGLFPVSAGFDINMQVQAVNGHEKKFFAFGLILLIFYPIGLQNIIQYMPLIILATLFGSLSLLSHKSTDFSYLWHMNKKSFCFIFFMISISISYETCLAVFYATIVYYFFYLRQQKKDLMYQIEKVNEYQIQEISQIEEDEENQILITHTQPDEQFKKLIEEEEAIVYTFGGRFNFFLEHFHQNNIICREEKLIIVNLERIHYQDADFLAEYFEIIKKFEQSNKYVYIIGLKEKYFTPKEIYDQGWILDYYQDRKILFTQSFYQKDNMETSGVLKQTLNWWLFVKNKLKIYQLINFLQMANIIMKLYRYTLILFFMHFSMQVPVHLIPHTHDDLGWNWTMKEYYDKWVKDILTSSIQSLKNQPQDEAKRKFVYSEVGFLKMYLNDGDKDKKIEDIKQVIRNGQFEFVNGGIAQTDEACPVYEDMISNYYYGHLYVKRLFKVRAVSAWQLDPFGHSKTLAYVASLFGFNDLVIGRISEKDKLKFIRSYKKNQTIKWVFPDGRSIRTHMSDTNYNPPDGLYCDSWCWWYFKFFYNKHQTNWFFAEHNMSYTYDPWYFFGNDFTFSNAESNFKYLDGVVKGFNNLQISLFSEYLKNISNYKVDLEQFDQDFFVYEESNGDSWSGYFTTKQALKRKIRELGHLTRILRSVVLGVKRELINLEDYLDIMEDSSIFMHHDSITGTAKRYVDLDYFDMIDKLEKRIYDHLRKLLKKEIDIREESQQVTHENEISFKENLSIYNPQVGTSKNHIVNLSLPLTDKDVYVVGKEEIKLSKQICSNKKCYYNFKTDLTPLQLTQFKIVQKEVQEITSEKFLDFDVSLENGVELSKGDQKLRLQIGSIVAQNGGAYLLRYQGKIEEENFNFETKIIKDYGDNQVMTLQGKGFTFTLQGFKNQENLFKFNLLVTDLSIFNKGIDLILKVNDQSIKNNGQFYTDSNGLFEMERQKVEKLEISVYPCNSYTYIKQGEKRLGYFTEVSQGVTSREDGQLMIYLQRSTVTDDQKGVDQPVTVYEQFLNEGYIVVSETENDWNQKFDYVLQQQHNRPLIIYSDSELEALKEVQGIPSTFRVVFDFIDHKTFLLRGQNVDRVNDYTITKQQIESIVGEDIKEVDFDFVFENKETRDFTEKVLKPLEFITIFVTVKQ